MGNPLKGAVSFKIGEDSHSLAFSAEALYRLEKETGLNPQAIETRMRDPEGVTMEMMRTIFWAGMLDEMPNLLLDEVGSIFSRINPLEALRLVTEAFSGAFTMPEAAANSRPPRPGQKLQPRAGTGSAS